MHFDVFDYTDPRVYLIDVIKHKQNKNRSFSLRSFSKKMGLNNHGQISLIINNKRPLNLDIAKRLSSVLSFSPEEGYYFNLLILKQNALSPDEQSIYKNLLEKIKKNDDFKTLTLDEFKFIANWYHIAILEMSTLPDFRATPEWISKRLRFKISETEISEAIRILINLELLIYCPAKLCLVRSAQILKTPNDIPSEAIQLFHMQSLENASQAIRSSQIEEREFSSYTMNIDKSKIPLAKEMMRNFQRELANHLESSDGQNTFQFQMQFFSLTNDATDV